jgi:bifunctional non-homologous end joining protein LigD
MASSQPGKPKATAGGETAALSTYRAKRDATKTPEPMGSSPPRQRRSPQQPTFVIQEHHARALHWDFRLEHDGVLVSWALPKGLPEDPSKNHLAVHTEDHPLEYGSFEGGIPKGEYGGGQVAIWDHGTYDLEKWTEREVKVVLHGQRSRGRYVLFPTRGKNWMIHRMDPPAEGYEPMPERLDPMLARSAALPTDDRAWAYEFKWDGVRAIVFVDGGRVRTIGRNDNDLTTFFPELRDIGEYLGARSAVLDGEIVAFDETGQPSFGRLQQRLDPGSRSEITRRARNAPASYLAFDLLYLEGRSLLTATYDERRQRLESLELASISFATPPSIHDSPGVDVLQAARDTGLGGIVAKRRSSPYRPGSRSGDWIKIRTPAP